MYKNSDKYLYLLYWVPFYVNMFVKNRHNGLRPDIYFLFIIEYNKIKTTYR